MVHHTQKNQVPLWWEQIFKKVKWITFARVLLCSQSETHVGRSSLKIYIAFHYLWSLPLSQVSSLPTRQRTSLFHPAIQWRWSSDWQSPQEKISAKNLGPGKIMGRFLTLFSAPPWWWSPAPALTFPLPGSTHLLEKHLELLGELLFPSLLAFSRRGLFISSNRQPLLFILTQGKNQQE